MTDKQQKHVNFADCYVLTDRRTKDFITSFLEKYLPNRQEYTDVYEVPQFSDRPTIIFKTADELIEYLEANQFEVHAIYWYNKEEDAQLRGTMCLFTSDGKVIMGIFCESLFPDISIEEHYFKDLRNFCGSTIGLIEYETPAARDTGEFLKRVQSSKEKKEKKEKDLNE
jgi:hypothetical protein